MFSPESYITPYIAAYLGKYVDNFNRNNFQVSLWQGDAVFNNVSLNLDVIEEELELPFDLRSGHIHEMKISVPWTKITSEPILVTINSIELCVTLSSLVRISHSPIARAKKNPNVPQLPPGSPGYIEGLLNKMIHNVKVVCHNVIIKYVEQDIVFSLNFESITLCTVDQNWEQAFIDLIAPDFILRRKMSCTNLTICLDKKEPSGLIRFLDPVMYKCSFDVRIFNKFSNSYSKAPFFKRLDILFDNLELTITNEQVPMLMRLYHFLIALTQLDYAAQTDSPSSKSSVTTDCDKSLGLDDKLNGNKRRGGRGRGEGGGGGVKCDNNEDENNDEEEESGTLFEWASWAVGWLPVPSLLSSSSPSPSPQPPGDSSSDHILHFGLYVNRGLLHFVVRGKRVFRGELQGVVCDIVHWRRSTSVRGGISLLHLTSVGECPCSSPNCFPQNINLSKEERENLPFLTIGTVNSDYDQNTLFRPPEGGIIPTAVECRFHCPGYETKYPEEEMIRLTPAIAIDIVEILPPPLGEDEVLLSTTSSKKYHKDGEKDDDGELELHADRVDNPPSLNPFTTSTHEFRKERKNDCGLFPCTICEGEEHKKGFRVVIGPVVSKLSIGFFHRYEKFQEAASGYNYTPYSDLIHLLVPDVCLFVKFRMDSFSSLMYENSSATFSLSLTSLRGTLDIERFQPVSSPSASHPPLNLLYTFIAHLGLGAGSWWTSSSGGGSGRGVECGLGGSFEGGESIVVGNEEGHYEKDPTERGRGSLSLRGISLRSQVGERNEVLCNPFGLRATGKAEWHPWLTVPRTILSLYTDPIIVHLGPQVILSFLQLYHSFGKYIQMFIEREEEEIGEIIEAMPFFSSKVRVSCDDLRSGALRYVYVSSSAELPEPGELAICEGERTLSWKYGTPHLVESIEAFPLPILESSLHSHHHNQTPNVELQCKVEYWDSAQSRFLPFGHFKINDTSVNNMLLADDEKLYEGYSSSWKISIELPSQFEGSKTVFTAGGVAASLRVNSISCTSRLPKLKIYVDIPRFTLHLINQRGFAGKIPERRLRGTVLKGLGEVVDQNLGTFEFSSNSFSLSVWRQRLTIEADSFIKMSIVDNIFLTEIQVIDPFNIKCKYVLCEEMSRKVFQRCSLLSRPILVKFGASAMHTITTSAMIWLQVLNCYHGDIINVSRSHLQPLVTTGRILVHNKTTERIYLRQAKTVYSVCLEPNECYEYTWPTHKKLPECEIGLSCPSGINWSSKNLTWTEPGNSVLKIGQSSLFVRRENIYSAQALFTLCGSLIFGNATQVGVEVCYELKKSPRRENIVKIQPHSSSLSSFHDTSNIDLLRFRINNSFSNTFTFEELETAENMCKIITLYGETDGVVVEHSYWCTLTSESFEDNKKRSLVTISPIYIIKSYASFSAEARVGTAELSTELKLTLNGRGEEEEMKYVGNPTQVHHLTLYEKRDGKEALSPTLPLLPGGRPLISQTLEKESINMILDSITNIPVSLTSHISHKSKNNCTIYPPSSHQSQNFHSSKSHNSGSNQNSQNQHDCPTNSQNEEFYRNVNRADYHSFSNKSQSDEADIYSNRAQNELNHCTKSQNEDNFPSSSSNKTRNEELCQNKSLNGPNYSHKSQNGPIHHNKSENQPSYAAQSQNEAFYPTKSQKDSSYLTRSQNEASYPTKSQNGFNYGPKSEKGSNSGNEVNYLSNCDDVNEWPWTSEKLGEGEWVDSGMPKCVLRVEFRRWIIGLPSVLLLAHPPALFTNLTGRELLFREGGGRVFSIGAKCLFSPLGGIGTKFSIGFSLSKYVDVLNSNGECWSKELEFTEQISPSSIHHINRDSKISLNAFSRININGPYFQLHVTIETKFIDSMLHVTFRPTYQIQNTSGLELQFGPLALSAPSSPPSDPFINSHLSVLRMGGGLSERESGEGMLCFSTDWDASSEEESLYRVGTKYLGIRYGHAPWWFCSLSRFETFFDSSSREIGMPVRRDELSIPSCQPEWITGSPGDIKLISLPLSLSTLCSNGQVVLSISSVLSPQLFLTNQTTLPLSIGESSSGSEPTTESDGLRQLRVAPPFTRLSFAFPSLSAKFPVIGRNERGLSICIGIPQMGFRLQSRITMIQREDEDILWSDSLLCSNETKNSAQSVSVSVGGRRKTFRVLCEKLGHSFHLYIKLLSEESEFMPGEVRTKISGQELNVIEIGKNLVSFPIEDLVRQNEENGVPTNLLSPSQIELEVRKSEEDLKAASSLLPKFSSSELGAVPIGSRENPYVEFEVLFPEIRLILTDDFSSPHQKSELLSLTLSQLYFERRPITGKIPLRCLSYDYSEFWSMFLRLSSLQIENGLFGQNFEFPLLFKTLSTNATKTPQVQDLVEFKNYVKNIKCSPNGLFTLQTLSSGNVPLNNLLTLSLKLSPFAVYMEDKFLHIFFPLFDNLTNIGRERAGFLNQENSRLWARLRKNNVGLSKYEEYVLSLRQREKNSVMKLWNKRDSDGNEIELIGSSSSVEICKRGKSFGRKMSSMSDDDDVSFLDEWSLNSIQMDLRQSLGDKNYLLGLATRGSEKFMPTPFRSSEDFVPDSSAQVFKFGRVPHNSVATTTSEKEQIIAENGQKSVLNSGIEVLYSAKNEGGKCMPCDKCPPAEEIKLNIIAQKTTGSETQHFITREKSATSVISRPSVDAISQNVSEEDEFKKSKDSEIAQEYFRRISLPKYSKEEEEEMIRVLSYDSADLEFFVRNGRAPPTPRKILPFRPDVVQVLNDLSFPVQLESFEVEGTEAFLTFHGRYKGFYFAFDHSPILLTNYKSTNVLSTEYALGATLSQHYLVGALYRAGNPVRLLGSLELLGSPGTFARSLGEGMKDFVLYPIQGMLSGPVGFIQGINSGCLSLLKNVSSGTLTCVTNFALSMRKNIDKLTLGEEEEEMIEESRRRVPVSGLVSGLSLGIHSFGVRLLGAVGGLAQSPIDSALASQDGILRGIVRGVGKGLFGAFARPLGATAELVASTGQGLLSTTGWSHSPNERKHEPYLEEARNCSNSYLKYVWKLQLTEASKVNNEKILYVVDCMDHKKGTTLTQVSIIITTENVYIVGTESDSVEFKESLDMVELKPSDFYMDPNSSSEFFSTLKMAQIPHLAVGEREEGDGHSDSNSTIEDHNFLLPSPSSLLLFKNSISCIEDSESTDGSFIV